MSTAVVESKQDTDRDDMSKLGVLLRGMADQARARLERLAQIMDNMDWTRIKMRPDMMKHLIKADKLLVRCDRRNFACTCIQTDGSVLR